MNTRVISPYHYAKVPTQMINDVKKPRALQILAHLLSLCNPNKPEVWIDQRLLGLKLGIHQDTAGIWIRYLEKIGRLAFLGYRKDGRRKRYRINLEGQENPSIPKKTNAQPIPKPLKIVGEPPRVVADNHRPEERYINKEEETNIKEQTVVDLLKKEFSSNEKIALKQKLKIMGVHKHVIERLVDKYSIEKINAQIEHLQYASERGGIEKPASWLISAIEKNYQLPKELDKNAMEEERKANAMRKAIVIAQIAKSELIEGNIKEALKLSADSVLISENQLAKEVRCEAEQILKQAEKIERARQLVSAEKQLQIRQEEERKKLVEMRRWGKSDAQILASSFFKDAVQALVNERLLAI